MEIVVVADCCCDDGVGVGVDVDDAVAAGGVAGCCGFDVAAVQDERN